MNPERFARIKELLLEATNLPEASRSAFLDGACQHDTELRQEIDELLAQDQGT